MEENQQEAHMQDQDSEGVPRSRGPTEREGNKRLQRGGEAELCEDGTCGQERQGTPNAGIQARAGQVLMGDMRRLYRRQ